MYAIDNQDPEGVGATITAQSWETFNDSAARAGSGIEAVPLATDEVRVDVRPSSRTRLAVEQQ